MNSFNVKEFQQYVTRIYDEGIIDDMTFESLLSLSHLINENGIINIDNELLIRFSLDIK